MKKKQINFRSDDETFKKIEFLTKHYKLSQSLVIEKAVEVLMKEAFKDIAYEGKTFLYEYAEACNKEVKECSVDVIRVFYDNKNEKIIKERNHTF